MTKFLKGFIIFIIFVGLAIFILEKKYSHYQNTYDVIFSNLDKTKTIYTDLYIGNSHTIALGNYSTKLGAIVINLATPGQDLFKTYGVLKKWIPQMHNLQCIYFGLDYENIGQNLSLSGLDYEDRQIYKYTDTLYKEGLENLVMAKSTFFRANRDVSYLFGGKDFSGIKNFIPPAINLNDENCKKRALEHSQIRFKKELIEENVNILNSIILLVQKNQKKLIVFNPPKSKCFEENEDAKNIGIAKNVLYGVLNTNKVKYFDYYKDTTFSNIHFLDYDHLNELGKKELIDKLNANAFSVGN